MPAKPTRVEWLDRISQELGGVEALQQLSDNAWSLTARGRALVAKIGRGAGDEADGLRALARVRHGPPVPEVVFAEDEIVVTAAVEQTARTPAHEESLGRALANLHATPHADWGGGSSWIGRCRVDASSRSDATTFYGGRLGDLAARCGLEEPVGRVVSRLPELLPPGGPALVHGDLWWGNVLFGADGRAWLIDPSVHGGHPEEDLAMLALFGAVPDRLFRAYQEVSDLPPDWPERVPLFQLYPLLVHAVLFGASYRTQAEGIARRYARTSGRRRRQPGHRDLIAVMAIPLEFWLYLPQMRLGMDDLVERARAAEAAGFAGVAGMDHLAPPGAESSPMFEAMTTNAWLAARTSSLRVGSLVLCDSFRHPVMLAREALTIDAASGGRFELGLGWGSVTSEFEAFGVGSTEAKFRVSRMRDSLEIITALWRGEPFDYDGEHFALHGAQQQPEPVGRIPIVIGGAGRKTMELVARFADWWNVHVSILDRFDEMRALAGSARCSLQLQVAFVGSNADREEIDRTARRRFWGNHVLGESAELVDYFGQLTERGVERVYVWFTDFAPPETLEAFGQGVIAPLARPL